MSTSHSSPNSSPSDDGMVGYDELLDELAEALYTNMPSDHKEKAIVPLDKNPEDGPGILVGDFLHSSGEEILKQNGWAISTILEFEPFQYRSPSKPEMRLIWQKFNDRTKGLAIRDTHRLSKDNVLESLVSQGRILWSRIRSLWRNSRSSSRDPFIQDLKNRMKPIVDEENMEDTQIAKADSSASGSSQDERAIPTENDEESSDEPVAIWDVALPPILDESQPEGHSDYVNPGSDSDSSKTLVLHPELWSPDPLCDEVSPKDEVDQPSEGAGVSKEAKHIHEAESQLSSEAPPGFARAKSQIWKEELEPVVVKEKPGKRKSRSRSKTNKSKKAKKAKKGDKEKEEGAEEILASFTAEHQEIIKKLPSSFHPTSTRHGQHSYTTAVQQKARVEVLLRQRAFKPKSDAEGQPVKVSQIPFEKNLAEAIEKVKAAIKAKPAEDSSDGQGIE